MKIIFNKKPNALIPLGFKVVNASGKMVFPGGILKLKASIFSSVNDYRQ